MLQYMQDRTSNTSRIRPDLVVVTGAGRGIGKAIALDAGTNSFVLCISQSETALEAAEAVRKAGGRAEGLVLDLEDYKEAETKVGEWISNSSFQRIAAVFAAAILGPQGSLMNSNLQDWDRTFKVNVLGNLAVARAILPVQKQSCFGRLLFFAGGGAAYAYPMFPAYAASKAALVRIVENLHEDLKGEGNFATAILAPGAVETKTLASVRASGAEIRTTVDIGEPTAFARAFIMSETCSFSGCFVHVRDSWPEWLNSNQVFPGKDLWKLRRVE
jgi:NAD(P)-dependent dehydrogenase (short-subunit alcohol dehydrogenase family)